MGQYRGITKDNQTLVSRKKLLYGQINQMPDMAIGSANFSVSIHAIPIKIKGKFQIYLKIADSEIQVRERYEWPVMSRPDQSLTLILYKDGLTLIPIWSSPSTGNDEGYLFHYNP
jgi:hypothetical protein